MTTKKPTIKKLVILAGGLGTRLTEETEIKPKPMIEIGGKPILWHIMKIYSHYGINEFIICLGYKGYVISEYFANYSLHMADTTIDLQTNTIEYHNRRAEPWRITLVDTGINTLTGGRLKRIKDYVSNEQFCLTYGDGVANINIAKLIDYHNSQGCLATVTAVRPPGRFGALRIKSGRVTKFAEKPIGDGGYINGGFFVMSPQVFNYIKGDQTTFEAEPMTNLALDSQLAAFEHEGFWQAMDTLRDKRQLEELWASSNAPWKVW